MSKENLSQVPALSNDLAKNLLFVAMVVAMGLALGSLAPLHAQEDDDEIEIILDGLVAPGGTVTQGGVTEGGDDDAAIETMLDGLAATGQLSAATRRDVACYRQRQDDHAASLPCATLVRPGELSFGELGFGELGFGEPQLADLKVGAMPTATDQDVFLLVLAPRESAAGGWQWLWTAEVDASVSWFDAAGQPLATYELTAGDRHAVAVDLTDGFYYLQVTATSKGPTSQVPGTYAWTLQPKL